MAATSGDTAVDAGIAQLPEVGFDLTLRRSGGQERGHHHPAWLRTKAGAIIGFLKSPMFSHLVSGAGEFASAFGSDGGGQPQGDGGTQQA